MTATEPTTDGSYRSKIVAVEPGGNEFIAEQDRHGKPSQLFWTWTSPNLEFATVFVGVLAVAVYGMSFWQAVAGIVIGTGLGALAHYFLSARGPLHGVPQMVLGRLAFGFKGNALPATLMSITAGVGWFATNSVSGAYALAALFGIGPLVGLIIIVVVQTAFAFFGHNLVQAFERWSFPVLAVIFAVASVAILMKSNFGAPALPDGVGGLGGFLLTVGTAFGYAAGWTPYAADYTRYLPTTVSTARTGLFASAGLFLSCAVLEIVGAASVTFMIDIANSCTGIRDDADADPGVGGRQRRGQHAAVSRHPRQHHVLAAAHRRRQLRPPLTERRHAHHVVARVAELGRQRIERVVLIEQCEGPAAVVVDPCTRGAMRGTAQPLSVRLKISCMSTTTSQGGSNSGVMPLRGAEVRRGRLPSRRA